MTGVQTCALPISTGLITYCVVCLPAEVHSEMSSVAAPENYFFVNVCVSVDVPCPFLGRADQLFAGSIVREYK